MDSTTRIVAVTLLDLTVLAVAGWWLILPRHHIQGVKVQGVEAVASGRQIVVTFSTPEDLANLRTRLKAGFIVATLFACDDRDAATREVVSQGDGYFTDAQRVRKAQDARGSAAGASYIATFDDRLAKTIDSRLQMIPAASAKGGLCFALDGGNMFGGKIWSDPIRVDVPGQG
ncbi:hypothetical protein TPR58_05690 [Sphingomonas sp. HF-S3]|uniref:Uncharacterized protein n=1 Tax=Sphingomonas rustica TaxID=3103142 RepID=A0ABV0B7W1_9SPHN